MKKTVIHTGMAGMRIFLLIMTALMVGITAIAFPYVKNDVVVMIGLIALSVAFGIGCLVTFNGRVVLDEDLRVVKLYFIRTRTISILDIKEIKAWKVPKSEIGYTVNNFYQYIIVYLKDGDTQKIPLYGTSSWIEYIEDEMKRLNKRIQELKGMKDEKE